MKINSDCKMAPVNKVDEALEIGARIEQGPSQLLIETVYKKELEGQLHLFDAISRVDLAHTLVMGESGIIPNQDACYLLSALTELAGFPSDFNPEPSKGDVYTNREVWLNERTPAGKWLGAGRARREAITTAYVIKLRGEFILLAEALAGLGRSIAARADEYSSTLMPDYTYLQTAQPTTFGHYLLGFLYPLLRDLERIRSLYSRLNRCPAGCGSSNGSRLPQPREQIGKLLGFDGIIPHGRDAMWQTDIQIEMMSILAAIHINLDRLAEDFQIFMTEEFSLVELDDRHARASKIMPQKKNPIALAHIRGMANTMIGKLAGTAALGRTPSGQPDNRLALYEMLPASLVETKETVFLMNEMISLLKFNTAQGRKRLENSFAMATDLADVLVLETGLSFREAHRLVGGLVRDRLKNGHFKGLSIKEITGKAEILLGKRIEITSNALDDALNPKTAIQTRNQPGGAAVTALAEMTGACREELDTTIHWCRQVQLKLDEADKLLDEKIQDYLISVNEV